jgi:hypothetical protein
MRIESNIELSRAAKAQAPVPSRKSPAEPNKVKLVKTDTLGAALEAMPDVRAEQVARARALIRDPGYPPETVVDQVAESLARRIRSAE